MDNNPMIIALAVCAILYLSSYIKRRQITSLLFFIFLVIGILFLKFGIVFGANKTSNILVILLALFGAFIVALLVRKKFKNKKGIN